jgi:hypothetical protein
VNRSSNDSRYSEVLLRKAELDRQLFECRVAKSCAKQDRLLLRGQQQDSKS